MVALAVGLAGCATYYDSTYWRHPTTGVTVECEASWSKFDQALAWRDYCDSLMQRAGLLRISHEEGKQGKRGPADTPPPAATLPANCPGQTYWNGVGCTSR